MNGLGRRTEARRSAVPHFSQNCVCPQCWQDDYHHVEERVESLVSELKPDGQRYLISVKTLMRSTVDGLMLAVTQGWQLSPGQMWAAAVLALVPVVPPLIPGPGWYDVVDVL